MTLSTTPCKRCLHSIARNAGVPFFRDPAHRIPTRWGTYRALLAETLRFIRSTDSARPTLGCSDAVLDSIRNKWRAKRGWTSIRNTEAFLNTERQRLAEVSRANAGDSKASTAVTASITRARAVHARIQARKVINDAKYAEPKPRLTGAYLRPTLFNRPLPRLTPQPLGVTMMIRSRWRARERRRVMHTEWNVWKNDMEREAAFARGLGLDYAKGWGLSMSTYAKELEAAFERDRKRSESKFDPGMMRRIAKARAQREASRRAAAAERKGRTAQSTG